MGLMERDFWQMTLTELDRYFKSRKRVMEAQERKQAAFDYIQADLIGRSIARVYNANNKFPSIEKAYPTIFNEEDMQAARAKQKQQKFLEGLKKFAHSKNKEIEEGGQNKE